MNDQKTIAIEVGGVSVSAIRLKEPIGQFTHWYVDEKTIELPRIPVVGDWLELPSKDAVIGERCYYQVTRVVLRMDGGTPEVHCHKTHCV